MAAPFHCSLFTATFVLALLPLPLKVDTDDAANMLGVFLNILGMITMILCFFVCWVSFRWAEGGEDMGNPKAGGEG